MNGPSEEVSVIIPCYNCAHLVSAAVESVRAQIHECVEVIVVDDGSTDDIRGALAKFGNSLIVRHQKNRGIGAARNVGVSISRGQFIAFLDADDLWPQNSVQVRLAQLRNHPEADYAYGAVEVFSATESNLKRKGPTRALARLAGALLLRRRIIEAIGGFDERYRVGETIDFVARIEAAGFRGIETPETVLRRRVHEGNTVLKQSLEPHYLQILRRNIARKKAGFDR